jgi:hypothetical protein
MSHAKRVRKAKMARRQAERRKRTMASLKRHSAFLDEQIERARFRKELNASDAPEPVKTLVGALVDPTGFVHDMIRKHFKEIQ